MLRSIIACVYIVWNAIRGCCRVPLEATVDEESRAGVGITPYVGTVNSALRQEFLAWADEHFIRDAAIQLAWRFLCARVRVLRLVPVT